MLNKLLMLILLGVALYAHNLIAFFGMIIAYIFGVIDARRDALKFLQSTKKMLKDLKEILEEAEKEHNQKQNHDK